MERGCGADEDPQGQRAEIDRRRNPVRWRGGIRGLASLIVLASSGGCYGEPPSARASAEEEEHTATSVEEEEHAATSVEGQRVESHLIKILMTDDMRFEPENPVVAVGDTVVWINVGVLPHTTTDEPGRAGVPEHNLLPAGAAPWDSGLMEGQKEFRAVFDRPGEYTYLCTLHEVMGMVGRVTVR